jgi:hypothetical protein
MFFWGISYFDHFFFLGFRDVLGREIVIRNAWVVIRKGVKLVSVEGTPVVREAVYHEGMKKLVMMR